MKTPATVLEDLMRQVRKTLYARLPARSWFTQQERVKAALTLPAKWLHERGVELPAARYEAILRAILDTILAKGRRDVGDFPCAYLWSCVESHLRHHGEEYYAEGKGIRNRVQLVMSQVDRARVGADSTVPTLAQVHDAVSAGRRKPRRKAAAAGVQADLFGAADAGRIAKLRAQAASSGPNCEKSPSTPIRPHGPT